MTKRRSSYVWIGMAVVLLALTAEVTLRVKWGFGTMLLYDHDPDLEYLPRPNQDIVRLGNRMKYNEYAMRSNPLNASDSCIILGFGDSVINGGTRTDQDSLATTMIEKELGHGVRFLNISAGSWGPDNCASYLKKYGDFNARMIVLFVNSHDAHDNIQSEKVVGVHPSYPDRQYPLAIVEVIDRYIIPKAKGFISGPKDDDLMINKHGEGFNTGFQYFLEYSRSHGIPLVVYLHAERAEVIEGKFNTQGEEIISFCRENNIKLISGLDTGEDLSHFYDDIHVNSQGQKHIAAAVREDIRTAAKACL